MSTLHANDAQIAAQSDQELFFGQRARGGFSAPTRLIWGDNCAGPWLTLMAERTSSRCLVVCDPALEHKAPVVALRTALGARAIWLTNREMPETAWVIEHSAQLDWSSIGWVVAFGGGSALDSAKALLGEWLFDGGYDGVGMGTRRGQPTRAGITKPLFIAVPSTAGSGAETSRYVVCYDKSGARWKKSHGKSWALVADVALLDPQMLAGAPPRVFAEPAFDAFVHCCESYVCQGEATDITRAVCLESIRTLSRVVRMLLTGNQLSMDDIAHLQVAACMAGVAISNARTGHVHEAGGAALEWCDGLTHAQTLWIFARRGFAQTARSEQGARLQQELAQAFGVTSMSDALAVWEQLLDRAGSLALITKSVAALAASPHIAEARASVVRRVADDAVWCSKESPSPITEADAEAMARCLDGTHGD